MAAQVKPTGLLKSYTGGRALISIAASELSDKSIRDILKSLNIPSEMVAMVLVNKILQEKDYIIQDGDVVQLVPLIGGG
jgi:sulfur carrier protein ThiS